MMKFIEKEENKIELACGDFILFEDKTLSIVIEYGREFTILFIEDGYFSYDYVSDSLNDLSENLMRNNKNMRVIKSKNIEIREIL